MHLFKADTPMIMNLGSYLPTAFAVDEDLLDYATMSPEDYAKKKTAGVDTTLISVLNTVIALISLIYVPFSMLSSWLLSPDWTF